MKEVRLITNLEVWDKFIELSEQGTIFCTSNWLSLYKNDYRIYGYYKGDNLLGGICGLVAPPYFDSGRDMPLTPFMGVLVAPRNGAKYTSVISMHNEVTGKLMDEIVKSYWGISVSNHYTYPDVRPFLWRYYNPRVKYTYVLKLDDKMWDNFEKDTRYEISKDTRKVSVSVDIDHFDSLYQQTFERKSMERPVSSEMIHDVYTNFKSVLYMTEDGEAGAVFIFDSKRAYYILGASDGTGSYGLIGFALASLKESGIKEVDFVGCNSENIARFKRGFGGILCPYYQCTSF